MSEATENINPTTSDHKAPDDAERRAWIKSISSPRERVEDLMEKLRRIANDVHSAWADIPDPDDNENKDQKSADAFASDIRAAAHELDDLKNALEELAWEFEEELFDDED